MEADTERTILNAIVYELRLEQTISINHTLQSEPVLHSFADSWNSCCCCRFVCTWNALTSTPFSEVAVERVHLTLESTGMLFLSLQITDFMLLQGPTSGVPPLPTNMALTIGTPQVDIESQGLSTAKLITTVAANPSQQVDPIDHKSRLTGGTQTWPPAWNQVEICVPTMSA